MLRAENEDLQQKIKANENLKKKIHTLQEQEKANVMLRDNLKTANERLEELDHFKQVLAQLEKEILEKKGLIRNQEYQINELVTTRKHAEYDNRVLLQKLQDARDRHDRDHEAMQELRQRLQDSNLDDSTTASAEDDLRPAPATPQPQLHLERNDESKHLAERLALVEQQLEAADARLKQAAERNAVLEEQARDPAHDHAVREYESTIAGLRKDLALASSTTSPASRGPTPAASPDVAVLQRENQLMTTAWYDLAGRLTSNGVSLDRRRQEPRSWIGKQRALVGPRGGVVSGWRWCRVRYLLTMGARRSDLLLSMCIFGIGRGGDTPARLRSSSRIRGSPSLERDRIRQRRCITAVHKMHNGDV